MGGQCFEMVIFSLKTFGPYHYRIGGFFKWPKALLKPFLVPNIRQILDNKMPKVPFFDTF